MKKFALLAFTLLIAGGFTYVASADDKDDEDDKLEKIAAVTDLPAEVQAALKSTGATFKSAHRENEDGVKLFEIDASDAGGKAMEIVITNDGQLLEIEHEIKEDALPAAVSKTIGEVVPKGTTEELVKKTVTVYEIEREVGDTTYELTIDGTGKVLHIKTSRDGDDD